MSFPRRDLPSCKKELAEKRDARNAMNAQLENEKTAIDRVNQLREKIVDLKPSEG